MNFGARFDIIGAEPGIAAARAQIDALTLARQYARARLIDTRGGETLLERGGIQAGLKPEDLGPLAAAFQDFASARLSELEAQIGLQRQLVDSLDAAVRSFEDIGKSIGSLLGQGTGPEDAARLVKDAGGLLQAVLSKAFTDPQAIADLQSAIGDAVSVAAGRMQFFQSAQQTTTAFGESLDIIQRGPQALKAQLDTRSARIQGLTPKALSGDAEAIAELQRILPEALQLGQQVLGPQEFNGLVLRLQALNTQLVGTTKTAIDVAKDQLSELQKLAQFAEDAANAEKITQKDELDRLKQELREERERFEARITALETAGMKNLTDVTNTLVLGFVALTQLLGSQGALYGILSDLARGLHIPATPRQHGGPVDAGRDYIVGEAGPERFRAERNGVIIPNGAASTVTMPITIQVSRGSAEAVVDQVEMAIRRRKPSLVAEMRLAMAAS